VKQLIIFFNFLYALLLIFYPPHLNFYFYIFYIQESLYTIIMPNCTKIPGE
jgi:hypothetical protein